MNAISRYPVPELKDLPADIRERIVAVQDKAGFVPNVFLTLAHRPAEFRAFFAYHDALMEKDSGLTKAEREMIVVATSGANQCQYCVVAHGAILRIRAKNPLIADQVSVNYRKADITPKQRAMLDFAMKIALEPWTAGEADFDSLREAVSPYRVTPCSTKALSKAVPTAGFNALSNNTVSKALHALGRCTLALIRMVAAFFTSAVLST